MRRLGKSLTAAAVRDDPVNFLGVPRIWNPLRAAGAAAYSSQRGGAVRNPCRSGEQPALEFSGGAASAALAGGRRAGGSMTALYIILGVVGVITLVMLLPVTVWCRL